MANFLINYLGTLNKRFLRVQNLVDFNRFQIDNHDVWFRFGPYCLKLGLKIGYRLYSESGICLFEKCLTDQIVFPARGGVLTLISFFKYVEYVNQLIFKAES